jgi:hypothetical protein
VDSVAEARLRQHVASIVDLSGLPSEQREDVAEELLGHLVSRTEELIAAGLDEEEAATRAIEDFGGVTDLAPRFREAFHSRLWASTIGVLLPGARPGGGRPIAVTSLAALVGLVATFDFAGAAIAAIGATPVRAVTLVVLLVLAGIVDSLAAVAILRGQRWGFFVGLLAGVVVLVQGLADMTSGPGTRISLSGIAAAIILIAVAANGSGVDRWFEASGRLPRSTAAAVGLVAALSSVAGVAPNALPDPTQMGPADIAASAAVTCWTEPEPPPEEGTEPAEEPDPNARLLHIRTVATIQWLRADWYPKGFATDRYGDAIAFLPDVATSPMGAPVIDPWPPDIEYETGGWGSTVPEEVASVEQAGGDVRGIDHQLIRAGNRITVQSEQVAHIVGELGQNIEPPSVEITYWHLDRFRLRAELRCDTDGAPEVVGD